LSLLSQSKETDAAAEVLERRRSELQSRRDRLVQQVKILLIEGVQLFV